LEDGYERRYACKPLDNSRYCNIVDGKGTFRGHSQKRCPCS